MAIAAASSVKAKAIVFSRPITSEIQPKKGRVRPLQIRSMDSARGTAADPKTSALPRPKSVAKLLKFETTIRPPVDIIVIMTNISQKIGDRSITPGATPVFSSAPERTSVVFGTRNSSAATVPMTPRIRPKVSSVWLAPAALIIVSIGNVVSNAPKP